MFVILLLLPAQFPLSIINLIFQENDWPVVDSFFAKFNRKKSCVPAQNVLDENDSLQISEESRSYFERKTSEIDYEDLQETILGKV